MAGISFSGLASGLKTGEIIDALMDVQKLPRDVIAAKQTTRQTAVTQLQSLNAALVELAKQGKTNAAAGALSKFVATSSSDKVTVQAGSSAVPMTTQVVVDKVAAAHSVVTAASTGWTDSPLVLTVKNSKGELVEVRPTTSAPGDIAKALTASGTGISATVVAAGKDAGGNALHRLQITSTATGAAAEFTVYRGDAAAVTAGTASNLATETGASLVSTAQDAQVRLWAGTAAEQVVTSVSNTFEDLFPDVDITVTEASTTPVGINVAANPDERSKVAEEFVNQIATMLAGIAKGMKSTPATAAGEKTKLGVFAGDSTVRALKTALTEAVQYPVDGSTASQFGIVVDEYGVLTFDKEKFAQALSESPEKVEATFAGVAARIQTVSEQYSDKYDGLLTARITGQESEIKTLGEQLTRWDTRLEQRRATLERTYAAMETMLSRLQSQSSSLASQIAGLPTYSSGE